MAILTATGTIDAARSRNGTAVDDASNWNNYGEDNNRGYIGVSGSGSIYVLLVKFTTPAFDGQCSNIRIEIPAVRTSSSNTTTALTMNYAIASSDVNKSSYATTSTVSSSTDPYQIASGTVSVSGLTTSASASQLISISAYAGDNKLATVKPNTTYYLYLWPSASTTNKFISSWWNTSYQTITLTYSEPESGIFMSNSDGILQAFDVYLCDTSGKPVLCDVYVCDDEGSPVMSYIP